MRARGRVHDRAVRLTADQRPGVGALFADVYRRDTIALWIIFGTNLFSVYTFSSWTPVILKSLGLGGDCDSRFAGLQPGRYHRHAAERVGDLAHRLAPTALTVVA